MGGLEEFSGRIIFVFPRERGVDLGVLSDKREQEELKLYNRKKDDKVVRGLRISGCYNIISNEIIKYTLTKN